MGVEVRGQKGQEREVVGGESPWVPTQATLH
jgi:hypothetical protein